MPVKIIQDKFTNTASVVTGKSALGSFLSSTQMFVTYDQEASELMAGKEPPSVCFLFMSTVPVSSGWQFMSHHEVYINGDGEPLDLVTRGSHRSDMIGNYLREYITLALDVEKFLELARCKQIDLRIGLKEYRLNAKNVSEIRAMAEHLSGLRRRGNVHKSGPTRWN